MIKIQMKQNIVTFFKNVKKSHLKRLIYPMALIESSNKMKIPIKILKSTTQIKNAMYE